MTTADVVGPDAPDAAPRRSSSRAASPASTSAPGSTCARATSGSFPIIVGEILVVILFGFTATNFFTAVNFVNLITQMAGTAMLAYGVVFVLLLGEIDLSIGYLAGIGALVVAELQLPGRAGTS